MSVFSRVLFNSKMKTHECVSRPIQMLKKNSKENLQNAIIAIWYSRFSELEAYNADQASILARVFDAKHYNK